MPESIGSFFRRERESRGLTLEEVGGRLGTTHATIQRYETGKRKLDYDVALQLADAIGISRRAATEEWIQANGGEKSLLAGVEIAETTDHAITRRVMALPESKRRAMLALLDTMLEEG